MSKIKLIILVLGGLLIGNTNVQAAKTPHTEQQSTPTDGNTVGEENAVSSEILEPARPVTREELEGVRSELAVVNDKLNYQLTNNIANTTRSLQISGIFQDRYNDVTYTSNKNTLPYSNGFVFNQVVLSFKGNLKRDYEEGRNVDYVVSFASSGATSYNLQPTDVYLQYSILQSLDIEKAYMYVQFGQQKIPFGLEPQVLEAFTPTVNIATFAGPGGFNLAARDIGIQLRGDLFPSVDVGYNYRNPFIQYFFGIFNGTGQNALDSNSEKDIVGRVVLNAPVDYNSIWRGLSLGTSIYSGQPTLASPTTGGVTQVGSRKRYGVDLAYVPVSNPIGITAEYVSGKSDSILSGNTIANEVIKTTQSSGSTVTLFYNFGEQFLKNYDNQSRHDDWWPTTYQPFVRFDHYNSDTSGAGTKTSVITYGFNWFFAPTTKLQLNYNVSDIKTASINSKNNQVLLQFQYGF